MKQKNDLARKLVVRPGAKVKLARVNPDDTMGYKDKKDVGKALERNLARLAELQYLLYAENRHALLIILQAMDAGGKDGTIRHVMSGLNPQGCSVTPFKVPSAEEADHDFLWRIHHHVPPKGEIGIFNRSHYEEVLVVRVHQLEPKSVWSARYEQINAFERLLTDNSVKILKFFLHISKDEQRERLQQRLEDPKRNWKISASDFEERKRWDDYLKAYEDALTRCSTPWAPWYVIPANKKWFRNFAVSAIVEGALEEMRMKYPRPSIDLEKLRST